MTQEQGQEQQEGGREQRGPEAAQLPAQPTLKGVHCPGKQQQEQQPAQRQVRGQQPPPLPLALTRGNFVCWLSRLSCKVVRAAGNGHCLVSGSDLG